MDEHDPVRLIADEQRRLARELQDLPTEVWTAPSSCAGWSNARVVGHLTFYAGVYRQSVTRALNGDTAPPTGPDGQPVTREQFMSLAGDRGARRALDRVPGLLENEVA